MRTETENLLAIPEKTVPDLCNAIRVCINKGDHAAKKADQFYIAAGQYLIELKKRCPKNWEALCKEHIGIGHSRTYEYIAQANGTRSVEQIRQKADARKIKFRESSVPERTGRTNVITESDSVMDEDGTRESDEDARERPRLPQYKAKAPETPPVPTRRMTLTRSNKTEED